MSKGDAAPDHEGAAAQVVVGHLQASALPVLYEAREHDAALTLFVPPARQGGPVDQRDARRREGLERVGHLAGGPVGAEGGGPLEEVDGARGDAHAHGVPLAEQLVEVAAEGEDVAGLEAPPRGAYAAVAPALHQQGVVLVAQGVHGIVKGLDPRPGVCWAQERAGGCEVLYVHEEDGGVGEAVLHDAAARRDLRRQLVKVGLQRPREHA